MTSIENVAYTLINGVDTLTPIKTDPFSATKTDPVTAQVLA